MRYGTLIILLLFIVASISAERIEIAQGDVVYMNETVDISRAISWPDYTVAWCKDGEAGCTPPDQIIEITDHMFTYRIDPALYHYGTYYRWDGAWHRAENSVAFTVIPGNRSDKRILTQEEKEESVTIKPVEGPYSYLIAKGDTPTLTTLMNRTDMCYLWLFTDRMDLYGQPMWFKLRDDTYTEYSYKISEIVSQNLSIGEYEGYIQCDGMNNVQDVFWKGNDTAGVLDTPYDNDVVPDVEVVWWNLGKVRDKFDELYLSLKKPASDDILIPIELTVQEPHVTILNVERSDDDSKIYISGITSWQNQTELQFKLDPDNYKLERDIRLNTWETYAYGSIDTQRVFNTALNIEKKELAVGTHEIVGKATRDDITTGTVFEFHISDIMVMPTPTPHVERILKINETSEMVVRTIPIPTDVTPTPEQPVVTHTQKQNESVANITTKVAGNITTAISTTPIPVRTTTTVVVPIESSIIISGLLLAGALRCRS